MITATLTSSIVAGTVNRRAEATGLLLAFAGAAGFLGPDLMRGGELPDEWLIGVPTLMVLIGVVGGFAGRLMVPPAPNLPSFGRLDSRVVVKVRRKPVRIAWVQVIFGVAISVAGSVYADEIRQALSSVLAGGGGSFGARSLVGWQVSGVWRPWWAVGRPDSTAGRGLFRRCSPGCCPEPEPRFALSARHGPESSPVIDFWADQLNTKGGMALPLLAVGVSTCVATGLGGWLGSHLFPPGTRD